MAKNSDITSMGGLNRKFPETEWTLMLDIPQREAILGELYEKYWRPLYFFLRGKGFNNEQAKDLVQGFFSDKVLGQEFLQKADRTKGRFRNFLLIAVRNYAINLKQKLKTQIEAAKDPLESIRPLEPEEEFNRAWADEVLKQVLKELKTECYRKDKVTHWEIFREWLLEPSVEGNKSIMSDICSKYGIEKPSIAYNMIANVKGRFRVILRSYLLPLVKSESDVDIEIAKFINIFTKIPPRY